MQILEQSQIDVEGAIHNVVARGINGREISCASF